MLGQVLAVLALVAAVTGTHAAASSPQVLLDDENLTALASGDQLYLLRRNGPQWFRFQLEQPVTALVVTKRGRSGSPETEFMLNGKPVLFSPLKALLYFTDTQQVVSSKGPTRLRIDVTYENVAADTWTLSEGAEQSVIEHHSQGYQRLYTYVLHWKEAP